MTPRQTTAAPRKKSAPAKDESDDLRPVQGASADLELAQLSRALGNPARVRVLRQLARREACIGSDLVEALGLAQSTVSQHLKVLLAAGLIQGSEDGARTVYRIDPQTLRRLRALIGSL